METLSYSCVRVKSCAVHAGGPGSRFKLWLVFELGLLSVGEKKCNAFVNHELDWLKLFTLLNYILT